MGTFLSERELSGLSAADNTAFPSPVPLQMISNGEFNPLPQTADQRNLSGDDIHDQAEPGLSGKCQRILGLLLDFAERLSCRERVGDQVGEAVSRER